MLERFLADSEWYTGSDEATLKTGLRVDAGEQLMSVGDVLLRLRLMVMVRRGGVVRPGGRRQTRVRVAAVGASSRGQGVVVMMRIRRRREVDAQRRRTGPRRLRNAAVRRRKVRRLEVGCGGRGGGVSSAGDVARRTAAVRSGTDAASGALVRTAAVQRTQLVRRRSDKEVSSVVLLLVPHTRHNIE